jgi:anti-anti-sigma regulatory factor
MEGKLFMSATFTKTGDTGVVKLDGDLTLSNAEEIKKTLIKAILDSDSVKVKFGKVQNVDLSCLQLLCSAHRSAERFHKQMSFGGPLPPVVMSAATSAGYADLKGCRPDCKGICLWLKTE